MSEIIEFPRLNNQPNNIEKAWEIVMGEVFERCGHIVPNNYIEEFSKLFRPMFENLIPINIPLPVIEDCNDPNHQVVKDTEEIINSYITHSIRTRRDRELYWFLREKYGDLGVNKK